MRLAVVRSAGTAVRSPSPLELDDFEQELVDQYALAAAASGTTDNHIAHERSVLFAFIRHIGRHVWTAQPLDVDGFLHQQRKGLGLAGSTVHGKAGALARFYDSSSATCWTAKPPTCLSVSRTRSPLAGLSARPTTPPPGQRL
ncbi:hypothetical protein [Kibdelosporangium aridum]|uniref:Integrase SAM-like N-terminal domain-containing protein n=1 Tax=Kibdelosporangium aridum TaxID=2030 RepID=A0A1W2CIT9_KIBAR|nr:hypothetical protein [Kibdelosporangium aridum]SMC85159.1 hypothetical protein SAMN05661093_02030 [Kibdelosporangium aridum]